MKCPPKDGDEGKELEFGLDQTGATPCLRRPDLGLGTENRAERRGWGGTSAVPLVGSGKPSMDNSVVRRSQAGTKSRVTDFGARLLSLPNLKQTVFP